MASFPTNPISVYNTQQCALLTPKDQPTPQHDAWAEPAIVINGIQLTCAQSMTVRVAIGDMLLQLSDPDYMTLLGDIGPLYQARAREIAKILCKNRGTIA